MSVVKAADKFRPLSLSFQFSAIAISTVILSIAILYPTKTFHSIDEKPLIASLRPADIKAYGRQPEKVRVGLIINHFNLFDTVKGEFELKGILWFAFDPTQTSLSVLEQCTFQGAKVFEKSEARTKLINATTLFAWYDIKVNFYMALQYKYFPYDDHTLYFLFSHTHASPKQVRFVADPLDFSVNTSVLSAGWDLVSKVVHDGYIQTSLNKDMEEIDRPAVLFSLGYKRISIRHSLSIILPILLIFFLSLGAFSIDHRLYSESVISLPIGSITGLIAYQFVIQGLSPDVGYFMVADFIFFSVLAALFIIFFCTLFIAQLTNMYKKIFVISIHAVVDFILVFILCFWIQ